MRLPVVLLFQSGLECLTTLEYSPSPAESHKALINGARECLAQASQARYPPRTAEHGLPVPLSDPAFDKSQASEKNLLPYTAGILV